MRIGLITQPLAQNYGGLLQNYALQKVIKDMGHEVFTIYKREFFLRYYLLTRTSYVWWRIKQFINKFVGRRYFASKTEFRIIRQHCLNFIENNIAKTETFASEKQLLEIVEKYKFDAYIVGSDQVWRPCFSNNIYVDFLAFCQDEINIKRIAYAASFGVDKWEFSEEQTNKCSRLAKLFDAISVREDSGIELCNYYLGVKAIQVLDPTMLLDKEDYIQLAKHEVDNNIPGDVFCYILDNKREIRTQIEKIEKKYLLNSFQLKAVKDFSAMKYGDNIDDYIIPSPTKWIRAFMDAKLVITDSFHGCVFSIIFNKPFWAVGNEWRGNARFESLLRLFNLEDRRIDVHCLEDVDLMKSVDWKSVNRVLIQKRQEAFQFLNQALQS